MTSRSSAALAFALACFALPAGAEPPGAAFLSRLVGGLVYKGASFACFSRQYDEAHLNGHPGQRVVFAKALVDAYFRKAPGEAGAFSYQVSLAFRFRGRPETLTQVAECGDGRPPDSLRGGAVCAGPGNRPSHLGLDGADVLVLTMHGGADMWAPGPIDKRHDVVKNPFGPDDVSFRLVRTDVRECEDLAFDNQKPLRAHEP